MGSLKEGDDLGPFARGMLHFVIAYAALGWGALEAISFLDLRYGWSPALVDGLAYLIAAGFPAGLVITWRHGRSGPQDFERRELILASCLFIGTFLGLWIYGPRGPARAPRSPAFDALNLVPGGIHAKQSEGIAVLRLVAKQYGLELHVHEGDFPPGDERLTRPLELDVPDGDRSSVLASVGDAMRVHCYEHEGRLEVCSRADHEHDAKSVAR